MRTDPSPNAVPIVTSGTPDAELVWWCDDGTPVASFAADELRDYVRDLSGATLPVTAGTVDSPGVTEDADEGAAGTDSTDSDERGDGTGAADASGFDDAGGVADANGSDRPVASLLALVPGAVADEARTPSGEAVALRDDWIRAAGDPLADARADSFAIRTVEGVVVLAGTTHRGTLYAAYDLLERFGVRFFAPDFDLYHGNAERVPDVPTIAVSPLDVLKEPSFAYRRKDVAEGRSHTARTIRETVDWMAKTKQNVLTVPADFTNLEPGTVAWDEWRDEVIPALERRGLLLETGGHGFDAFLPPEEYGSTHPEWFVDGSDVFDVTEEAAVETYVENVVAYLERHPEVDVFDAWPPDWVTWPDDVVEAFGSGENAYAYVIGRLHDAVREQFPDRDVAIEALAYEFHYGVPDDEFAYPDDVVVDFAVYDRSYETPIFEAASGTNAEYLDLMADWREAFDGHLCVHEYYRKYSWHSLPVVLPSLIGREIPAYDAYGFDGIWIYSEPADWLTYELTHSLVAALAWNADRDAGAFVEEYLADRYGAAAADVESYLDHVETAGRTLFDSPGGRFDDPESVSEAREAYRRAEEALTAARATVEDGSTAAFLLDRLATNAEFAVADTSIGYHQATGDEAALRRARTRTRELVEEHCFEGVVLKSEWTLSRCSPADEFPSPAELIGEYRDEWGP